MALTDGAEFPCSPYAAFAGAATSRQAPINANAATILDILCTSFVVYPRQVLEEVRTPPCSGFHISKLKRRRKYSGMAVKSWHGAQPPCNGEALNQSERRVEPGTECEVPL